MPKVQPPRKTEKNKLTNILVNKPNTIQPLLFQKYIYFPRAIVQKGKHMDTINFPYIEKYLGTPELRPLWQNKHPKSLGLLNTELGVIEKAGPILPADIELLKDVLQTEHVTSNRFASVIREIHQNCIDRNPYYELRCAWLEVFHKDPTSYQAWYDQQPAEHQALADTWKEDFLFALASKIHNEEQLRRHVAEESTLEENFYLFSEAD